MARVATSGGRLHPGSPADNAVMEHWWADFKSIWLAHSPQPQTFEDLEHLVTEGIDYFTHVSTQPNDGFSPTI